MEQAKNLRFQITKIWAKNFRGIRNLELSLNPLTVLVGPNASGKSTVLDILRFVADALRSDLDTAIATRQGISSIRRWSSKGRPYDVEVGLRAKVRGVTVDYGFVVGSRPGGQYVLKREYGVAKVGKSRLDFEVRDGILVKPDFLAETEPRLRSLFELDGALADSTDLALPVVRRMFMGRLVSNSEREPPRLGPLELSFTYLYRRLIGMSFYQMYPNLLSEPQKPGNPYPLSERGENLASALREMLKSSSPLLVDLKEALGNVIPRFSDVRVSPVGGYLVVKLRHGGGKGQGEGAWFDAAQESDGTFRLLGLLIALHQSPPPSLIGIEEPELTIHPGAVAVLSDQLEEASHRSQILVTTHSPDLIDRLPVDCLRAVSSVAGITNVGTVSKTQRTAVRKGLFSPGELHRMEGLEPDETAQ